MVTRSKNTSAYKTIIDDLGRICTSCGEYKLWKDFKGHSRSKTKHSSKCKECYKSGRKATARKQDYYSAKKRLAYLKKNEPYVYKSRMLRSRLLGRSKDTAVRESTPTIQAIEKWLKEQPLVCYYSSEQLTIDTITVDHKIPIARGGDNSFNNLCIASHHMNTAKGQMTEQEFFQLLELISIWEDKGNSLLKRLKQGHF